MMLEKGQLKKNSKKKKRKNKTSSNRERLKHKKHSFHHRLVSLFGGLLIVGVLLMRMMSRSTGVGATPNKLKGSGMDSPKISKPKSTLVLIEFEVSGKVQKVSMRKYAQKAAVQYGVTGHIRNTETRTVRGEACGSEEGIGKFKKWLERGSPKAAVEGVLIHSEGTVDNNPFPSFEIRKVKFANGKQWAD